MANELVLSLFPGIGMLDRGFEEEGFVVVRGPDLLWGGDVTTFTPPPGRFDAVIGGPPCQTHSRIRFMNEHAGQKIALDLIPDFALAASPRLDPRARRELVRPAPPRVAYLRLVP